MTRILFNMIVLKLSLIDRRDFSVSKLLIGKEQELGFNLAETHAKLGMGVFT